MIPDQKNLSEQIDEAIRQIWCEEGSGSFNQSAGRNSVKTVATLPDKNYFFQNANGVILSKLQKRLEALEELNDHLYYYLNFLLENLPRLISKTMQSGFDINNERIENKNGNPGNEPENTNRTSNNILPLPTPRENDVIELLEKGYCAKEIASKLFISETTVITHKKNLKKKFNVKNTVELISKLKAR